MTLSQLAADAKKPTITGSNGQYTQLGFEPLQWNYMMAAAVVFTLPLIIVFFLGYKHFLKGISFNTDVG